MKLRKYARRYTSVIAVALAALLAGCGGSQLPSPGSHMLPVNPQSNAGSAGYGGPTTDGEQVMVNEVPGGWWLTISGTNQNNQQVTGSWQNQTSDAKAIVTNNWWWKGVINISLIKPGSDIVAESWQADVPVTYYTTIYGIGTNGSSGNAPATSAPPRHLLNIHETTFPDGTVVYTNYWSAAPGQTTCTVMTLPDGTRNANGDCTPDGVPVGLSQ